MKREWWDWNNCSGRNTRFREAWSTGEIKPRAGQEDRRIYCHAKPRQRERETCSALTLHQVKLSFRLVGQFVGQVGIWVGRGQSEKTLTFHTFSHRPNRQIYLCFYLQFVISKVLELYLKVKQRVKGTSSFTSSMIFRRCYPMGNRVDVQMRLSPKRIRRLTHRQVRTLRPIYASRSLHSFHSFLTI